MTNVSGSLLRIALAGALTLGIVYVFCWIGAVIGVPPVSHMFVALFTIHPITSIAALFEGTCWALGFGAIIALVYALLYRLLPVGA